MDGFTRSGPPSVLVTTGAALACALVAWIDYRTGPVISLALLYLVPILLTGWWAGIRSALLVAVVAAGGWLWADLAWSRPGTVEISVWNGATRLAIFAFCGAAIARVQALRKQAELSGRQALGASESRYRELFRHMQAGSAVHEIICDESGKPVDYRFLEMNPAFEELTGLRASETRGRTVREVMPEIEPEWIARYGQVALTGEPAAFEMAAGPLGRRYQVVAYSPALKQFATIFTDVTERHQLQVQLEQAMRMEAVGRLAGGVAHDFNNVLTVIIGNTQLVLDELPEDAALRTDMQDVLDAAHRAANLTKQLLAFSRQQVLDPRIMDLNESVMRAERLLGRLLGEDIRLRTRLAGDLGKTRVDPTQIEQVIVNLAVNARDAMPGGGQLLIETANADLDEEYVRHHPGSSVGPHVMLAVTDTGTGMDEATQARIFEPFFTTKELGKGTGLGLSTIYGIVKQSGGSIYVYSEVGRGTTFKIYLPRVPDQVDAEERAAVETPMPAGSEVILVAEDAESVRETITRILTRLGYTVIATADAAEALERAEREAGAIDLLITDVVMPGMSGRQLAERLCATRPAMRVLYVSGYTDDSIVQHGILEGGIQFLQKPFTPDGLARKVREVLTPR